MRKNAKLTAEDKAEHRQAKIILEGTGLGLVEAAKIARALRPEAAADLAGWTIEEAITKFLGYMLARLKANPPSCAQKTYDYYDEHLWFWADQVDDSSPIAEMDRPTLRESLDGIPRSGTSIQTTWRAVRRLFNWAAKQEKPAVLVKNPVIGLELEARTGNPKRRFYPVEQVEKLFVDPGKYYYAYVCMFFAGIRPWEVRGEDKPPLRYEHVVWKQYIRVPEAISKTGRKRGARTIKADDIHPSFWRLWKGAPKEGDICPHAIRSAIEHAKKKMEIDRWIQDGARHTYATMDIAARSNPGKTVLVLGLDEKPTVMNRHYVGNEITYKGKLYVATKARGKRYMAMARPKSIYR